MLVNWDDDDDNDDPDVEEDETVTGENDLVPLVFEVAPDGESLFRCDTFDFRLVYEGDGDTLGDNAAANVRLWKTPQRGDWPAAGFRNYDSQDSSTEYSHGFYILGDFSGDGVINNFDIDPYLMALVDPEEYETEYATAFACIENAGLTIAQVGDTNGDGLFNNFDTDPFVDLVVSGDEVWIPVRMWVEGVKPSAAEGATLIEAYADADDTKNFSATDSVRVTVGPLAGGMPRPWGAAIQVTPFSTVDLASGNLFTSLFCYVDRAFGPSREVTFYNNSAYAESGLDLDGAADLGFGPGWSVTCVGHLDIHPGEYVDVWEDDGQKNRFFWSSGTWHAPIGVHDSLEYNSTSEIWTLTRKNQWRRFFDEEGRLFRIADSNLEPRGTAGVPARCLEICYGPECPEAEDEDVTGLASVFSPEESSHGDTLFYYENDGARVSTIVLEPCNEKRRIFVYYSGSRISAIENTFNEFESTTHYFWYGDGDRLWKMKDGNNNLYEFLYDDVGRVVEIITYDPTLTVSHTQAIQYGQNLDGYSLQTTYFDRLENEYTYTFNSDASIASLENPEGDTVAFAYDADRNRSAFTNERENTWNMEYDGDGNMTEIEDPLGHVWGFEYDSYNNLTKVTPPLDDEGAPNEDKEVLLEYEDYYDTDPTNLIADPTHLTKVIEPATDDLPAGEIELTYYHVGEGDGYGEIAAFADALAVRTEFKHVDNVCGEGEDPPYDADGVLYTRILEGVTQIATDDYLVDETTQSDDKGRPLGYSNYVGGVGLGHNTVDDNTSIECAGGDTASEEDDPPAPYLPEMADCCDGLPALRPTSDTTITPDRLHNMTASSTQLYYTLSAMTASVSTTLDELSRPTGMTLSTNEPMGPTSPQVARVYTIDYSATTFDEEVTDPDSNDLEYIYNTAHRLTQVKVDGQPFVTYTLWPTGKPHTAEYANGATIEWNYDAAERLQSIIHTDGTDALLELTYFWTPDNLIQQITNETETDCYEVHYAYDQRSRLIREWTVDAPSALEYDFEYLYDQNGNRRFKIDNLNDLTTTYCYDVTDPDVTQTGCPTYTDTHNNRLLRYTVSDDMSTLRTVWYAYDLGGNVKRIVAEDAADPGVYEVICFAYTQAQQLWLIRRSTVDTTQTPDEVTPQLVREIRYQDDGKRYLVRDHDPANYATVLRESWHEQLGSEVYLDQQFVPSGTSAPGTFEPQRRYIHGYGLAGFIDYTSGSPGPAHYIHADFLGSTRLMTDDFAALEGEQSYTAWGELLPSSASIDTRYAWCGAWGYDSDDLRDPTGYTAPLGIVHIGARWYDPQVGRWLQRDPIGLPGGPNTYVYVWNEPPTTCDPSGLDGNIISVKVSAAVQAVLVRALVPAVMTVHAASQAIVRNIDTIDIAISLLDPDAVYWDSDHGNLSYSRDGIQVGVNDGQYPPNIRTVTTRTKFPTPRFTCIYRRR